MIIHAIQTSSTFAIDWLPLIQRLPDELLLIIFRKAEDPLKMSQVCLGWRTLALNDSYLWTTLYIDHRGFYSYSIGDTNILNLYLARARSAPLTVTLDICYVVGPGDVEEEDVLSCTCMTNLKQIASHVHHIRELKTLCDAYFSCFDVALVLQEAFSIHNAPVLESLEYSTLEFLWANNIQCYPQVAPSLRFLRLHDTVIPWNAPILQNLTELYINIRAAHEFSDGGRLMEIHELFSILRACPSLAILYLRSCLPQNTALRNDSSVINLPFLIEIFLWDLPPDSYSIITQRIKVPLLASWYIQDKFPSGVSLEPISALLHDIGTQIEMTQPREVTAVFQNDAVSLFSSHFVEKKMDSKTARRGILSISFKLDQQQELVSGDHSVSRIPILRTVAQIISIMNFNNNVVKFVVRFKNGRCYYRERGDVEYVISDSVTWTESILRALPKLEYLGIKLQCHRDKSSGDARDLMRSYKKSFLKGAIRALTPGASGASQVVQFDSKENDYKSKIDIICPNLDEVEIVHGYGFLSADLMRCLESRSEHGAPIRSVKLAWSEDPFMLERISSKWVDDARKVSDTVIVEEQPQREHRDSIFKPKHARLDDDSNGSLMGYFEYDVYS